MEKQRLAIAYSECVAVDLVIQHAKCMLRIVLSFVVDTGSTTFLHVSQKRHDFRKKCIERQLLLFNVHGLFGPQRDEVTGKWRKLHNEELNNLYSSPNIVRVIKSRRMRWAGHVARMGEGRGVYRVLVE